MDDGFDRRKLSETTESRRYIPEVVVTIYYLATGEGPDAKPLIPLRATSHSTGLDLLSRCERRLHPWKVDKLETGVSLHVKAPPGVQSLDIQVRGRSGLASEGMLVHPGTIDLDYRGELSVLMLCATPRTVTIEAGQRIAQLIIPPFARNYDGPIPVPVNVRYEFGKAPVDTERGEGAYGSTGR